MKKYHGNVETAKINFATLSSAFAKGSRGSLSKLYLILGGRQQERDNLQGQETLVGIKMQSRLGWLDKLVGRNSQLQSQKP